MPAQPLRIPAYAKVNLSLEVIGRRGDGYHEIATILQTVDLADTVTIRSADALVVDCDDPELTGEANIVWHTAVALAEYAGVPPCAHISIDKRIPVAAGLGGGSADAAAALRGLNRLWSLNLSDEELASVASALGSDLPFLIRGGTALGTGRGDQLTMLPPMQDELILLVAPPESLPGKTPTMYRALTEDDFSSGERTRRMAVSEGLTAGQLTTCDCLNSFARAALEIFSGLADVWGSVSAATRFPPCLSGAGPSFFCMPSDQGELGKVASILQETGSAVYLVRTINPAQAV